MTETNWQTSLKEQGAVYDEGTIQHFGHAASELSSTTKENTICDLSHLGLLSLTGEDARTFLQGQVTNDVNQLNGTNAHFSAYCSPKGRMLALFLAFSQDEKLYLQFSQPILAAIMKRLKMYVMRSKVEITDMSEEMVRLGLNGPDIAEVLKKTYTAIPSQDYEVTPNDHGLIVKLPSITGHSRYELIIKADQAQAVWDALKSDCKPVGKPCWDWLDIQTGIPEILATTQEQFVPQMLNLDLLNGINFKKGCYTGQEIVARTHYLGKVKRRTYLASVEANEQPVAGDKVMDATGNEAGQIVKAAPNQDNGFDTLIEMRIEAKDGGNVTWHNNAITFGSLPYAIESES